MTLATVETIEVAGLTLVVERPAAVDELISEQRFAEDEFLPYWAELWPAGLQLAKLVARVATPGLTVLELGAGLGLPSLVAAARGASVTACDWSPEAVAQLRANAARNGVALRAEHWDWGDPARTPGCFELVIAADVLYEARNIDHVARAFAACLTARARGLLLDPGRRHAEAFPEAARRSGLLLERKVPPGLERGALFELRRRPRP